MCKTEKKTFILVVFFVFLFFCFSRVKSYHLYYIQLLSCFIYYLQYIFVYLYLLRSTFDLHLFTYFGLIFCFLFGKIFNYVLHSIIYSISNLLHLNSIVRWLLFVKLASKRQTYGSELTKIKCTKNKWGYKCRAHLHYSQH